MEQDYDSVLTEAERTLDDVDHALSRLHAGTYGTCEACGQPIDELRLTSMPTARSCGHHPQLTDRAYGGPPDGEGDTAGGPPVASAAIDPDLDAVLGFADGATADLDYRDLDAADLDRIDLDLDAVDGDLDAPGVTDGDPGWSA